MSFEYIGYATYYDPDTDWHIEVPLGRYHACTGMEACTYLVTRAAEWLTENDEAAAWQLASVRNEPTGN